MMMKINKIPRTETCPLPDPDVGLSVLVCDVEHTSFHFGLCGRKFVLCLFGQCIFYLIV